MPPLVTLLVVTLPIGPVATAVAVFGYDVTVELTALEPPVPEPTPEMTWVVQAQSPSMSAVPRSTA